MAPSLNTKTLPLCSLFSLLLLFLHVHASSAGEMNVEELPKHAEASSVPKKDDSYNYKTFHGDAKKETQPYITAYINHKKDKRDQSDSYLTAYGDTKRENQPYITGYIKDKKVDQPYIIAYGDRERVNKPYITGYINHKRVNEPYMTAYRDGKKYSEGKNPKESYSATYGEEESENNPDAATTKLDHTEAFKTGFFTLDDLYAGNKMTLQFPIEEFPHFLTRKTADSVPFSTSQLPSVLQLFSVPQDSPEAQAMGGTLEQCELQPLTAETKVCVSSLESMVDFVSSIIGSDSQLDILTTTLPATSSVPLQNLTVLEISADIYAPKWVACHPLPYPYAVFYCHFISSGTRIFKVRLASENGDQMEALGICHLDTSEWSPDHILFEQLGIKPGEAPVCHFFPVKHLMWVPIPTKATM
ncbi:BURP domain-containing protein BNM2C-like isoform X2 [Prosopis cineraria]|uniref:BURP domain-containing protein BNM2C-like isoform X2 n=1 Tax=Prosopis cineraria TaxID=364024 RepID=UPI0024101E41|nr:BURP domain-containing protein BNM2C-like isoform X2 [Prosopis cineraria]